MTLLNQKDWLLIKIIYTQSNQIQTHPKKKKKKKKKSSQNPLPKVSKSTYPPFYHLGFETKHLHLNHGENPKFYLF
jgi:hypothetical protein